MNNVIKKYEKETKRKATQKYFDTKRNPFICYTNEYVEYLHKLLSDRASEVGVQPVVMPNEVVGGGQWQKCPKCDGQGIVSKPPHIAGDQNTWTDTQTSHTCNLCNGMMVIRQ